MYIDNRFLRERNRFATGTTVTTTVLCFLCVCNALSAAVTLTRIVQLTSGRIRGVMEEGSKGLGAVEMYLGVPYATPPLGTNRFSPTRSVAPWAEVRVCDRLAPVCPQRPAELKRGAISKTKVRLAPFLRNQSEDCLHLNIYVPKLEEEEVTRVKLAVLVFIHGSEDFSSGSGNSYNGRVLAAYTKVIVVTVNYRLGALGFLNLNANPESRPRVANSGLMDQIAALQWVQQNIRQFGGDVKRVTLAGHGTGAACVHFLASSPAVMPGLFQRVLLMSGSARSSWALVADPVSSATSLALSVNCTSHVDVVGCLEGEAVSSLLQSEIRSPAFLHSWGPSVDGVVIPSRPVHHNLRDVDVLVGVVTGESLNQFTASDIQSGFDGNRRDRIIRTYVRNVYSYHLPEIFATIVNEYTDWERTVVHPINTRDATIAALSDAQFVAPVVKTADVFSADSRNTFFYVFDHQTKYGDFPQRIGTAHEEELAYMFGAPLVDKLGHFPRNFTRAELALSEAFMTSLANFIKTGDPNKGESQEQFLPISREKNRFRHLVWDPYDPVHQKYMEISLRPKMKNHFRSHHLSIWLQLIPELEKAGMEDTHNRQNHFNNNNNKLDEEDLYTGLVRSDPRPKRQNATVAEIVLPITTMETMVTTCVNLYTSRNTTSAVAGAAAASAATYSSMLSLTVAVGLSLLVLNLLIFTAVCYQREKTRLEMKTLEQQKRLGPDEGVKHSASVVLDMDQSPVVVLNHRGVSKFLNKSHDIPPLPASTQKRNSLPAAAISEITV